MGARDGGRRDDCHRHPVARGGLSDNGDDGKRHMEDLQLAVILANAHCQGLKYGPDFNSLRSLPLITSGKSVSPNTVYASYDQQSFDFPGKWDTDSRLCLQAQSPRPVTCLAAIIDLETRESA